MTTSRLETLELLNFSHITTCKSRDKILLLTLWTDIMK